MGKRSNERPEFFCASVSWGAGSLYMLIKLLEEPRQKLNMVIFVNMGKEFDGVLKMRDKMLPILREKGIDYKEINISKEFTYDMYARPVHGKETGEVYRIGHGFCGGLCRYGTALKLDALYKYYREELSAYRIIEYVGICADEEERTYRNAQSNTVKRYPLVEMGIEKKQALIGCYERGYLWDEELDGSRAYEMGYSLEKIYLYELLSNASCYVCKNKNLKELKSMFYLMNCRYWDELKHLQEAFPNEPMKGSGKSVQELEQRFLNEGWKMSLRDIYPYPETVFQGENANVN